MAIGHWAGLAGRQDHELAALAGVLMLLDKFQIDQTRQRFNANAQKRTQNEKLIREGKLLQVDSPERVSKFLARRGLIRSTRGLELAGGLQPGGEELAGSGGGEALE